MALVTSAELSSFLNNHGVTTVYDLTFMDNRITAADAWLLKRLNRSYGSGEAEARNFDGSGIGDLVIDACQTITAVVEVDEAGTTTETYTATADYRAYPYNEDTKRLLKLHSASWPRGKGNIKVTATYGEGTAPADVKEAEMNLAALSVLAGANLQTVDGALQGAIKSYSTGVYEVTYKDNAGKNFVSEVTGWKQFIDEVIAAREERRPF